VLATARDIESLRELSERYGDQVKLFELDVTDEWSAAGEQAAQPSQIFRHCFE
jgi:NADP-dependent 3-hydroxy acid dehydrogenase YdfG